MSFVLKKYLVFSLRKSNNTNIIEQNPSLPDYLARIFLCTYVQIDSDFHLFNFSFQCVQYFFCFRKSLLLPAFREITIFHLTGKRSK